MVEDLSLRLLQENLIRLMREKKLSAREVAKRAELDSSQLHRYLKGKRMPELRIVSVLARALLVSPAELLMTEEQLRDRGHGLEECVRRVAEAALSKKV